MPMSDAFEAERQKKRGTLLHWRPIKGTVVKRKDINRGNQRERQALFCAHLTLAARHDRGDTFQLEPKTSKHSATTVIDPSPHFIDPFLSCFLRCYANLIQWTAEKSMRGCVGCCSRCFMRASRWRQISLADITRRGTKWRRKSSLEVRGTNTFFSLASTF